MACRRKEISMLEADKAKIEEAIELLIAARDKSDCVDDECDWVDYYSRQTFITENIMKLSENLTKLNDDGEHAISRATTGLHIGLAKLKIRLSSYQKEDEEYHASHPEEPSCVESDK
jgi:predicted RNase H-like HicB family nuclease